ncbi:MAG: RecQ family ATP-dependent DNA helicase, partial [Bosea sp. (in: a-proteobacteria)]
LFYVAMTRARRSLAVMAQGRHAFVTTKGDNIVRREASLPELHDLPPERRYIQPELGQVFIDWAGRLPTEDRSIKAIEQAQVGAPVTVSQMHRRWFVADSQGRRVTAMRADWAVPAGLRIVSARVGAIVTRHAHESGEEHRQKLNRESWEVILPEIVLE